MKAVSITVEGLEPGLLMHRFPLQPIPGLEKLEPKEQAEHAAYRSQSDELIIPGMNMQRALVAGAAFSKGKGRASLQKVVAACVFVRNAEIGLGTTEFAVHSCGVVVPATKGRIVRHRPWLQEWQASFEVEYDDTLLSAVQIRAVVDDTGSRVGVLDFRPACKGPFGRFMVTEWKT